MAATSVQKKSYPPGMMTKTSACPLGINITACVLALSRNNFSVVTKTVLEANALPSICGRVCAAPCLKIAKVDIPALRSFAEHIKDQGEPARIKDGAQKVAIIGGGPSGLAAAHRLLSLGLKPVIYESSNNAGGMLGDVVPDFALPRDILKDDIANLEKMGTELHLGQTVGKDISWDDIEKNYAARIVATGAQKGLVPPIPGADLSGVTNVIDFCRSSNNSKIETEDAVVVQGGSLTALHGARLAKRRGAKHVVVVHPFPMDLWPVESTHLELASSEGIELLPEHRVVELWGSKTLEQVIVRRIENPRKDCVGRIAGGDEGKQKRIIASKFVAAVNRKPMGLPGLDGFSRLALGNLKIDSQYRAKPGWYAAGEAATGPDGVLNAMITGQLVAETIKKDMEAK